MRGYRLFRMARDGLAPVVNRQHELHENGKSAVCLTDSRYDRPDPAAAHAAPSEFCTCGYYAYYSREQLEILGEGRAAVVAVEVEGYGTLRLHDSGFRAQYQDIVAVEWPICLKCGARASVVAFSIDFSFCSSCFAAYQYIGTEAVLVMDYLNALVTRYGCEIKEAYKPSWTSVDTSEQSPNPLLNASTQAVASLNAMSNAMRTLNISGVMKMGSANAVFGRTRKPYRLSEAGFILGCLLISFGISQGVELLLGGSEFLWAVALMYFAGFYAYCAIVAYGLTSAYFRCRPFPADPLPTAIPTAVLGPIGLAVAYLLGDHGEHGLMYP